MRWLPVDPSTFCQTRLRIGDATCRSGAAAHPHVVVSADAGKVHQAIRRAATPSELHRNVIVFSLMDMCCRSAPNQETFAVASKLRPTGRAGGKTQSNVRVFPSQSLRGIIPIGPSVRKTRSTGHLGLRVSKFECPARQVSLVQVRPIRPPPELATLPGCLIGCMGQHPSQKPIP